VGRLVVCWEMITGAAASGVLPRGCVPLEALDLAANMTPGEHACVAVGCAGWVLLGESVLRCCFAASCLYRVAAAGGLRGICSTHRASEQA
jgi:hypothetical protein